MTTSLVLPHSLALEIQQAAELEVETAGVLLVKIVKGPGEQSRILVKGLRWVPEDAYLRREANGLTIIPEGYVPFLGEAEALGASCIWLHTHPGLDGIPTPSSFDKRVDRQLSGLFRLRSGSDFYGSVIFSAHPTGLEFTGEFSGVDEIPTKIDRLWQVGDRLRLVDSFGPARRNLSAAFDRSVRAFGPEVQRSLGDLTVGIVGCGGTGSIVAEQLARLGVRNFLLVDPDRLSESNVTRVYGSKQSDIGRRKIDIVGDNLKAIDSGVHVTVVEGMITTEVAARELLRCDIVFGCTDDNAGRLVLSRFATFCLTPVIDCGVLLSSGLADQLTGIDARVTVLAPGYACLICRGRIDLSRAAAELLTPHERVRRQEEGYAPALGRTEPAVVSFTTLVGATAVCELLERMIGYGPSPRPSEVLLRLHDREVSVNLVTPRPGHYCHPVDGMLGVGDSAPFLGQTWPA